MPDITQLILNDHQWFRQQFADLDELQASPDTDPDELSRKWEPLASRLDVHAIAEEKIFYPQLLAHGEDPEEETRDAIGDHNDIRDGVAQAERNTAGSQEWWDGVWAARRANDEHMGEEENEGLANFRLNASTELRDSLGEQFREFMAAHPTATNLDNSDKDPEEYLEKAEAEIEQPDDTGNRSGSGA